MINSRNIDDLHACLKRGAQELTRRVKAKGHNVLVTSTYRDYEAQNALYAQGRTAPGNIVTNAKAGQSIHNFRLAFDICKNVKGQEYNDALFFETAGAIWTNMGGEWGGSWASFPDRPHFQFTGGLTLKDLQQGKHLPYNAKMKWETVDGAVAAPKPGPGGHGGDLAPLRPLSVSKEDKALLCKIVHWEARGEDEKGKMLVVYVILNRVAAKGFPDSIHDVIYQPGAFSPVKRPDFEQTVPTPAVVAAVDKALAIKDTISQGATYFASDADLGAPFFVVAVEESRIAKLFKYGGHTFLK